MSFYVLLGLLCGFVASFPLVAVVIRLMSWQAMRRLRQEDTAQDDDSPPFV